MTRGLLAALLAALSLAPQAFAQPKGGLGQLGVDVGRLKSGRTVRGALYDRDADGASTWIVRREWLAKAHPEWSADVATANRADQQAAWEQTRDRLELQLATPPEAPRVKFLMTQELERIKAALDAPPPEREFLWLPLEAKSVAQVTPAAPARQRIAQWAWSEQLADVETRDVATLAKELKKLNVKPDANPPDLSDRFPPRPQDDHEWAARLALVEYTLDKPYDLQGTGDTLIAARPGRPVDVAAVMPALLNKHLQSVLSELSGTPPVQFDAAKTHDRRWVPEAIRLAEQAGVKGVRITRVDVAVDSLRATVFSEFLALVEPGEWRSIWQTSELADGSQSRPELEARIARDPQVKAALQAVQWLGLGADGQLPPALRVGAATMAAQQTVDQRFYDFRDRYAKRLDGPPLRLVDQ